MLRRPLAAALVTLCTTLALLPPTAAAAAPADPSPLPLPSRPIVPGEGDRALDRAAEILIPGPGDAGADAHEGRIDASLALRDVFLARPTMDAFEEAEAELLLARPTDGTADPFGDGYDVPETRECEGQFCVHWVETTDDAPEDPRWARRTTLEELNRVWDLQVDRLGYRPPPSDGRAGGGRRFDVYLKDLGGQGLYGYCTPEALVRGLRNVASGFCVLDDDFAETQYGRRPVESLRVTAAHEFFHAVQFGYDFREDPWLLESTATWMEERFADPVDDNRTYLRFGQLRRPSSSLDDFDPGGLNQYGNWPFWEFLTSRYGDEVMRQVWQRAGAFDDAPDDYSLAALEQVVGGRTELTQAFGQYAASNKLPGRNYAEGRWWPRAPARQLPRLSQERTRAAATPRIDHLSSRALALRPARSLRTRAWQVRVRVDAPHPRTSPAAYLVVKRRDGEVGRRPLPLDRDGVGRARIGFDRREVRRVLVILVNASTRYRCGTGRDYATCEGSPKDDDRPFALTARLVRR